MTGNPPPDEVLGIEDLNIGHNIVARACLVGMTAAIKEMLAAMKLGSKLKGRA